MQEKCNIVFNLNPKFLTVKREKKKLVYPNLLTLYIGCFSL